MHHRKDEENFVSSLDRFFKVLKITDEYEIINMKSIKNKCVLIENNDLFLISKSLTLKHHS